MKFFTCLAIIWACLFGSLHAQQKQFKMANTTIPEEYSVYDTVIVFNPETYEETVTVTQRDSREMADKVTITLELSGNMAESIDTVVTFDGETFLEEVHIYHRKTPVELKEIINSLDFEQQESLAYTGERKTTEITINHSDQDFELFLENTHPALILSIVNSGGDIIMSKEIDANQTTVRMRGQALQSGTYKIIRSDAGQTVKLVVKD